MITKEQKEQILWEEREDEKQEMRREMMRGGKEWCLECDKPLDDCECDENEIN